MSSKKAPKPAVERIIIHIGMHKTGSSSIQQSLFGFDKDGVLYADLGAPSHTGLLTSLYAPGRMEERNARKNGFTEETLERIRADVRASVDKALDGSRPVVIFSSEELEQIDRPAVQRMYDDLRPRAKEVLVLGFVRPIRDAQVSGLQQRTKGGACLKHMPDISYSYPFGLYRDVFGADAVRALRFDPKQFRNGSLLETFMEACGLPDVKVPEVHANEGLAGEAVRCIYALNTLHGGKPRDPEAFVTHRNLVRLVAASIDGPKLKMPPAAHDRSRIEAEVEWARTVLGVDFSDQLEGTNTDPDEASQILISELQKVQPETERRIIALALEETGNQVDTMLEGMSALYEAQFEKVRRKSMMEPGNREARGKRRLERREERRLTGTVQRTAPSAARKAERQAAKRAARSAGKFAKTETTTAN